MASIATITAATEQVHLQAGGEGEHVFTVNNAAGRGLKLGARVVAEDDTPADWFELVGETERDFADRASGQIRVRVRVPGDAPDGEHRFHLTVFDVNSPGEHFTEGPTVFVNVTAKAKDEEDPSFPWWIVAVGVVLLLAGGGLLWWLAADDDADAVELVIVPDVQRKEVLAAAQVLSQKALGYELKPRRTRDSALVNRVVGQEPDAGSEVEAGHTITLFVGQPATRPGVLTLPEHVRRQLQADPLLRGGVPVQPIQPVEP